MNQQNGIARRKLPGLSAQGLRIWGLLFLAFGMVLNPSMQTMLAGNEISLWGTTAGLVMQLVHVSAIPIFSFLLVEGFTHTTSVQNYGIRIAILALITVVPYNLAIYGKLFCFDIQNIMSFRLNPVFGLLLALILLHFFNRFPGKKLKNVAMKALLWFVAFLWAIMLHIEYGIVVVLLVPIIYFLREKRMMMIFVGCIAMTACGFFDGSGDISRYIRMASYVASAPVAFMIIHFYNGEQGESNRYVNYLAYPAILLAITVMGKYAL